MVESKQKTQAISMQDVYKLADKGIGQSENVCVDVMGIERSNRYTREEEGRKAERIDVRNAPNHIE